MRKGTNQRLITEARPDLEGNEQVIVAAQMLDDAQEIAAYADTKACEAYINQKMLEASNLFHSVLLNAKKIDLEDVRVSLLRLSLLIEVIGELKGARDKADSYQEIVDDLIKQA